MATTPNFGLPLYEGSDPAKLSALLSGQSVALDTNLHTALGTTLDDTGWRSISAGWAVGFSPGGTPGPLQYRIKGGICYWRGGGTGTSLITSGSYLTVVEGIPSAARPTFSAPVRSGAAFPSATGGFAEFHTDGRLVIAQSSGQARSWFAVEASYPLG